MAEQTEMSALDRQFIDTVMAHVLSGDEPAVGAALSRGLQASPRLHWNPPPEGVENPRLAYLYEYWSGLRQPGCLPDSSRTDLLDLQGQAAFAMLLDVKEDGWDFRYRYYGCGIAERSGFDLTGLSIWETPLPPQIGIFFAACYRAVLQRRLPLLTWHAAPPELAVVSWDRLILPLTGIAEGPVTRLLVGNIPGAWRYVRD